MDNHTAVRGDPWSIEFPRVNRSCNLRFRGDDDDDSNKSNNDKGEKCCRWTTGSSNFSLPVRLLRECGGGKEGGF